MSSKLIVAREKKLKLAADQIRPLVSGLGACIATDKITVGRKPVAYMIREKTTREGDSGWVFTSGTESQGYMDDPTHSGVYDVNTIANYDPDIIPFLRAPVGSSFERPENKGAFVPCAGTDWTPGAPAWPPPGFPIVEGAYELTKLWSITLPSPFARCGSLR